MLIKREADRPGVPIYIAHYGIRYCLQSIWRHGEFLGFAGRRGAPPVGTKRAKTLPSISALQVFRPMTQFAARGIPISASPIIDISALRSAGRADGQGVADRKIHGSSTNLSVIPAKAGIHGDASAGGRMDYRWSLSSGSPLAIPGGGNDE